ncbi:MAG: DHA2 family efflux MFS transporter permease subunit [Synergistaceae bacterium]|jgi:EmrB/QacA subfamily drug resistance transporter|nr:DHA2 family efflux MFS transporter permease subunit [Synergistaceae bacterium]
MSKEDRKLDIMLWVVAIGFFMQTLDSTIVNTALPSIAKSLNVSPMNMESVVFSYSLMVAMMTPASGWLADKIGTQIVYLFAVSIFSIGSFLCAISDNLTFLVCSRVIQGFGGSMLLPVGRLAIMRNFPNEKFLPAISFMAVPGLIGPLLGPTLGGWLSEDFSWHLIFLINVPFGVLGIIATLLYMPNNSIPVHRFDVEGCLLVSCAMAASTVALGGSDMGISVWACVSFGVLFVASTAAYILWSFKTPHPLFDLSMFRIRSFSIGISGNLFARIGINAMPYLLPILFQTGMMYSPGRAGMMMLPQATAAILVKRPATPLIRHFGYRNVLIVNTILVGTTMAMFSVVSADVSLWVVCALSFVMGAVNSIQFTAMNTYTLADLPQDVASGGNCMLSMMQMLGMTIGVVIAGLILSLSGSFAFTFMVMGCITLLSTSIFWNAK